MLIISLTLTIRNGMQSIWINFECECYSFILYYSYSTEALFMFTYKEVNDGFQISKCFCIWKRNPFLYLSHHYYFVENRCPKNRIQLYCSVDFLPFYLFLISHDFFQVNFLWKSCMQWKHYLAEKLLEVMHLSYKPTLSMWKKI